ncbi:hypothetical protein D9M71_329100 [compost metagenome]
MGRQVQVCRRGFVGQRTDCIGLQSYQVARQAVEIIARRFDQAPMQDISLYLPIGVGQQRRAQFLQGVKRLEATGDGVSENQGTATQRPDQYCRVDDVNVRRSRAALAVQVDQAGA